MCQYLSLDLDKMYSDPIDGLDESIRKKVYSLWHGVVEYLSHSCTQCFLPYGQGILPHGQGILLHGS